MTEREILSEVKCGNYCGIYESENGITQYEWGKYDYSVPKEQQSPDYGELLRAASVLNKKSNTHFAIAEYGDKYNSITTYTLKALSENKHHYEEAIRNDKNIVKKLKAAGFSNKEVDTKIKAEIKIKKDLIKTTKELSLKLGFEITTEQYEGVKKVARPTYPQSYGFEVKLSKSWNNGKKFDNLNELFAYLQTSDFRNSLLRDGTNISESTIYIDTDYFKIKLCKSTGYSQSVHVGYNFKIEAERVDHDKAMIELIDKFTKIYLALKKTK